jgi:GNAT superfamily N-acetyltransferase
MIEVRPLLGEDLRNALPSLAELRITVFREWPYLYDGTLAYEQAYLERFSRADDAVLIAAFDANRVVGAATASPLMSNPDVLRTAIAHAGIEPKTVVYFGESVLLPAYRGRGIGHRFFDLREAHAARIAGATCSAFCAVERAADHPLQPATHRRLDVFWSKRGYVRAPGVIAHLSWRDIDQAHETAKPMQFWMRPLARPDRP